MNMTNDMKLKMFQEMLETELEEIEYREKADKARTINEKVADNFDDAADMWNNKGQGVWNCMSILGVETEYIRWAEGKNDLWAFRRDEYNEL